MKVARAEIRLCDAASAPADPPAWRGRYRDDLGGEFWLLVAAVMICCGVWSAGLARAASKAAGVRLVRMAASVRA